MITIEQVKNHVRLSSCMADDIDREKSRTKQTGEVFTPTELVNEILDKLPEELFTNPEKTFLDPSCGNGSFLTEVLIKKMQYGSTFEQALKTIFGVDIMQDNIDVCRNRLLCGQEQLRYIVEKNIVCHDALTYNYLFGEPSKMKSFFTKKGQFNV